MPARSRQVDRLVDRVKRAVREIDRFIVAVEEMKRERHPEHRGWKGACSYCVRKLITIKNKIKYALELGDEEDRWEEAKHFMALWQRKARGGPRVHMEAFYAHHYVG